jgi:hypothetical protein
MSALYIMRYVGLTGTGAGAVYVGKGKILGVDITGGKIEGTYTEEAGRLKGQVVMLAPRGGGTLVTGRP